MLSCFGKGNTEVGEVEILGGPDYLNGFHVWAFGICMVLGGQYVGWNLGLSAGFGYFAVAAIFTAAAYSCMVLCISEISSALPFGGGSYGIARVTIGVYQGYLIAMFDSLESVIYTAAALVLFAQELTTITELHPHWEILTWILCFIFTLFIQLKGGVVMWKLVVGFSVFSVAVLIVFILAASRKADFNRYAAVEGKTGDEKWFNGDGSDFMTILPMASWLFVGVESCNLVCKDVKEPKKNVPWGYFFCMVNLIILGFAIAVTVSSTDPGLSHLIDVLNPLDVTFVNVLDISPKLAAALSLTSMYASVFGFTMAFSRQVRSMGESGIVNPWLKSTVASTGAPYAAICTGWCIVFVLCFAVHFEPTLGANLFELSMLFAYSAYLAQVAGYIMFRRKLGNINRQFVNPLGEYAAYFAAIVFSVHIVSLVGYQPNQNATYIYIVFITLATVYYHAVVKKRQYFSKEEQQVLFVAHVQKNNAEKRKAKAGNTSMIPEAILKLLPESWRPVPKTKGRRGSTGSVGTDQRRGSTGSVPTSTQHYSIGAASDAFGGKVDDVPSPAQRVGPDGVLPKPEPSFLRKFLSIFGFAVQEFSIKNNKVGVESSLRRASGRPSGRPSCRPSSRRAASLGEEDSQKAKEDWVRRQKDRVEASVRMRNQALSGKSPPEVESHGARNMTEQGDDVRTVTSPETTLAEEHLTEMPDGLTAGQGHAQDQSYIPLAQASTAVSGVPREGDVESSADMGGGDGGGAAGVHVQALTAAALMQRDGDVGSGGSSGASGKAIDAVPGLGTMAMVNVGDRILNDLELSEQQLQEVVGVCNEDLKNDTYMDSMIRRSVSRTHSVDMSTQRSHSSRIVNVNPVQSFRALPSLRLRSPRASGRATGVGTGAGGERAIELSARSTEEDIVQIMSFVEDV